MFNRMKFNRGANVWMAVSMTVFMTVLVSAILLSVLMAGVVFAQEAQEYTKQGSAKPETQEYTKEGSAKQETQEYTKQEAQTLEKQIIGNDFYAADSVVQVDSAGIDSVFAAGEIISIVKSIMGSAYLAGKNITVKSRIGQNVYAAGQNIRTKDTIARDAFLIGENVMIDAAVGRNARAVGNDLRAAGDNVQINGNVGGDLLVAARNLEIAGTIAGDVVLVVEELIFAEDARILGSLAIYTDEANVEIPASVIAADRVTIESWDDWDEHTDTFGNNHEHDQRESWFASIIGELVFSFLAIFAMATFGRKRMALAYARAKASLVSTWNYGFLALSVLIGGMIVSAITIIGIPVALVAILATIALSVLGYFAGGYFVVCRIWEKIRKGSSAGLPEGSPEGLSEGVPAGSPEGKLNIAIASLLAAVLVLLLSHSPWLSWWFMLALTFYGVGALVPYRCIKK